MKSQATEYDWKNKLLVLLLQILL